MSFTYELTPNTTYWLAPGTHTLGTSEYGQFQALSGDTFIGAPGAVLNGEGINLYAFVGGTDVTDVTIEYLTIEGFVAGEGQSVVNQGGSSNWTIVYNTIENNPDGAAVNISTNDVVTSNCLTENGEYGFDGYVADGPSLAGGPTNVTITNNEISYNGAAYYPDTSCGCSGGGKFWETGGGTVTGNYVHNNYNVGIWVDTDNYGFNISDNYIADNYTEGIQYEASYNAVISNNTIVGNGYGPYSGGATGTFDDPAVYISESGGDSRVPGPYSGTFEITGNVFTNNWGGVMLWENANRYCSDGFDTACTLVDPSVYTMASCTIGLPNSNSSDNPDYFDNCRWKTENVSVAGNIFNFAPTDIPNCTTANYCGFNGLFSEYGGGSSYGTSYPYKGWVVPNNISNHQNNRFADNTYSGPWNFVGFGHGDLMTWAQWRTGISNVQGSGDGFGPQDAGSTFRIYGTDAIGTSIAISQQEFPAAGSAKAVVLARSDFFADALAGGPLAAKLGGPLLIAPGASLGTTLDPRVQAEIQRVLPVGDTVYILGGDLALSPDIDTQLQALGYVTQRIAGADEYGTAVDIAEAEGNPTTIFEATGLSFQDTLSAVPAAIEEHGAILLTDGTSQAPETAAYLAANPGDTRYAIGGPLAAYGADPTATPVYGQDFYGTSAAVAKMFFPNASIFGAATAADFRDALGGGVFMATGGRSGPLLLVNQSTPLPAEITPYLASLAVGTPGYVFGGPLAVGAAVLMALQAAVG